MKGVNLFRIGGRMQIIGSTPAGKAGVAYSQQFSGIGGTGPYSFTPDSLPSGWTLVSGLLHKASPSAQTFDVEITMGDSARTVPVKQTYTVVINA